jgi:integrase
MALTDTGIKKAKPAAKPQRLFDGGGMYLEVMPTGGKLWRLKYRFGGKEKRLALGSYPDTGLKDAREKREAARKLLAAGVDPSEYRKAVKAAGIELTTNTFEAIARQWFTLRSSKWVASHADKVINRLERDIFPWLGSKPIKAITRAEILSALNRVVDRGAIESARRAGFNLAQIFRFAIDNELADRNPAANLGSTLPSVETKHRAAITDVKEIGGLLRAMESYQGSLVTQCALRLAPLVFVRPVELRSAEWAEIDFDKALWTIPAEKMKMRESHIVPLSKQALAILKELHPVTGKGRYVFPSAHSPKRAMSNNAVLSALRRMGYTKDEMSGHGFRAMARTVLDETLHFRPDYIEHQLAHAVRDPNGRAYNRTSHLAERNAMMQQWADYLDTLKQGGNVVPMKRKNTK